MSSFDRFRRLLTQRRTTAEDDPTTGGHLTDAPDGDDLAGDAAPRRAKHPIVAGAITVLAGLLVLFALVAPDQISRMTPGTFLPSAFVRIPIEGLVGVALLLALPPRPRRIAAVIIGVTLGLLTIVKIVNMGFFAVLARPMHPVLDWILVDDAVAFLTDSMGRAGAIAAVIAIGALAVGVLITMTLAVRRLARVLVGHRRVASRTVAALTAAWVVCAVLGVYLIPGLPVAADAAATLAYSTAQQVPAGLRDREAFAAEVAVDAFRDTPGKDLLTGLRGKDVVFAFVESYGRDAVEDPEFAPQVDALLDTGTGQLRAAGFASRSAFLTSPTAGGGSWLAHATLLSGLWINSEQRYRSLVSSDRLTLTSAFGRADWRTVGVMPGMTFAWPEGAFYGYDKVYDSASLGYRGPKFSWSPMPDQYALSAFERAEHAKQDHAPLMAEIPLTSSHMPWAPIPRLVDWDQVGDGSVFTEMAETGEQADAVWRNPTRVRTEYRRSVEYSLSSLISYVQTYGDDDLVLVFLGDHQPAPMVTGADASHDVPITVVARDPAVLDRISGWGWQDGLNPGPQAPLWRMDEFRDRFLTAFGPQGGLSQSLRTPR